MKLETQIAVLAITLAVLAGCSSTPEKVGNTAHGEKRPTTVASIEAKQLAAEQQAAYVVEVEFVANTSTLTNDAKKKIESFYSNIAEPTKLRAAKIIAWADREYPAKATKKLDGEEITLAKDRAAAIESLLKNRNASLKFELYNMAERPGKLSEYLGGADVRIKESLERAGISTTTDKAVSKARKAIVMLIMDEKKPEKKN